MFSISINVIFNKTLQLRATNGSMCQALILIICVFMCLCVSVCMRFGVNYSGNLFLIFQISII